MYLDSSSAKTPMGVKILTAFAVGGISLGLIAIVLISGEPAPGLQQQVAGKIQFSGVENPVTAVLLNFRAYDTLLEIAVLLVVAVAAIPKVQTARSEAIFDSSGSHSLATAAKPALNPQPGPNQDKPLSFLVRLLVPVIILLAAYMLWIGAYEPGGAFQAGALAAAAGILISLSLPVPPPRLISNLATRVVLALGLAVFVLVPAVLTLLSGTFLQFPPALAGQLILLIEVAATLSIAITLYLLFTGLSQQEEPEL